MKSDINLIKGLHDWSRDTDRLIPKDAEAAKSMNGTVAEDMGLYIDDKGYFHTSGTVGVGWIRNHRKEIVRDPVTGKKMAIMITPRYSLNPWDMLIKVMNDPEYELYASGTNGDFFEIYTNQELIPVSSSEKGGDLLAAISFVKECERICKKYLRRSMAFEEGNFNGKVVGNIQVAKHIKANVTQGRDDRIYCKYPVFTVDTLENRVMKAALIKARNIFRNNNVSMRVIGRIYSYCENSLKEVRTVSVNKSTFSKVNVTGFNSVYKNVMDLAKTVILGNGANDLTETDGDNTRYVIPYTINMESLFEFYVRATLREFIKERPELKVELDDYRMPQNNPLVTLKEPERYAYLMNNYVPDIALIDTSSDEKKYIAVFDVKYQNSTRSVYAETRRHNSHQLLFYTLLLNVRRCGFIFPTESSNTEDAGIDIHELNIQDGDAMDSSNREYTQWSVAMNREGDKGFTSRIMGYVLGLRQISTEQNGDEGD